ncbi:MAG: hypothetical protein M3347_17860 [Armatimonadota bacterium]|nr:hypothetical protein [Armatimonadota bacterium]
MTLYLPDGRAFSTGVCDYAISTSAVDETATRLFIPVRVAGLEMEIQVMLDTGGFYLILHPDLGAELKLHPDAELERKTLLIRGLYWTGGLHRVTVTLLATEGQDLEVDMTAFAPDLHHSADWE